MLLLYLFLKNKVNLNVGESVHNFVDSKNSRLFNGDISFYYILILLVLLCMTNLSHPPDKFVAPCDIYVAPPLVMFRVKPLPYPTEI